MHDLGKSAVYLKGVLSSLVCARRNINYYYVTPIINETKTRVIEN